MSILGTGIVGSLAQTGLQSQQVARQRDRANSDSAQESAKMRELLESHLESLEEDATYESPSNLQVDQHLPDRQAGQQQQGKPGRRNADDTPAGADPDSPAAAAPNDEPVITPDSPLYKHLDVQA